ncbi:MAG: DNA polymerase III subunit delta [Bacteroidaceae bacterium]|nr:DNA polymerase III subunit delta [Bacteroidaceae bacterium]
MAKATDKFNEIMTALKNKDYKPIYVLHGEEPYYIDVISDFIEENVLAEEERDFNQTILYGLETSAATIADQARRFPMMAERQVIIVKEAQNIKKWEQLETYLDNPSPTSVIVICHKNGKIDGRKKIVSKAQKVGVVFESVKKYANELPDFVAQYIKEKYPNISIEQKAVDMIVEHIGNDLLRISTEIDKVVAALANAEKKITPELIEQKVGISKEFNGFELQEALAVHDVVKAMRIADYFAKDPKVKDNIFSMMSILFSFFQNLMACHMMQGNKSDSAIAQLLGLRGGWFARNYVSALRFYSAAKTLQILSKIRETDIKMKGVDNRSATSGDLLRELVFFILH